MVLLSYFVLILTFLVYLGFFIWFCYVPSYRLLV